MKDLKVKRKSASKYTINQMRTLFRSGALKMVNNELVVIDDLPTPTDMAKFNQKPPSDLFGSTQPPEAELRTITLLIKGEPVPKQSTRFTVIRHRSDGSHWDARRGIEVKHLKGDVLTFPNKYTKALDVNVQVYTAPELAKEKARIIKVIYSQLANLGDFKMFTKEVHMIRMDYVFPILKSFTKKKTKEVEDGIIHYKTTKPDLPDNLKKLVFDSMSGMVYKDDALICVEGESRKRYGVEPGILIELKGR